MVSKATSEKYDGANYARLSGVAPKDGIDAADRDAERLGEKCVNAGHAGVELSKWLGVPVAVTVLNNGQQLASVDGTAVMFVFGADHDRATNSDVWALTHDALLPLGVDVSERFVITPGDD